MTNRAMLAIEMRTVQKIAACGLKRSILGGIFIDSRVQPHMRELPFTRDWRRRGGNRRVTKSKVTVDKNGEQQDAHDDPENESHACFLLSLWGGTGGDRRFPNLPLTLARTSIESPAVLSK